MENATITKESNLVSALSRQLADAVEKIGASLVLVNGRQRQAASGIVFAPDLILTADHVLEREEDLTIQTYDKRTLPAQFVGRDLASDLAVIRVEKLNLPAAAISSEAARVGQLVLAVGRPSTDGVMASVGIVSALGGPLRTQKGITLEQYIRTDAIPYPGFSGGSLIDAQGAIVGILTTGVVSSVALAIPTANALKVADTLAKQGYIKRGYLGFGSQPVEVPVTQRAGRKQENGLLVVRVEDNSPAQASGLMVGDIVLSIDGQTAGDAEDVQRLLSGDRVGKAVAVEVVRGDALHTLQVTIGERK